jgi:hypothetical protein
MAQELTNESVISLKRDIQGDMQLAKVRISKDELGILQRKSPPEFPANENITSFVTSTHQRNAFKDIDHFYKQMIISPKLWLKKFIYLPDTDSDAGLNEMIAEAADMAIKLAHSKTASYPRYDGIRPTRKLLSSITTYVNGIEAYSVSSAIRNSEGAAYFELANIAEYGSTAEARAVMVTGQQGLIFYAANRVQRKYPTLGITFNFKPVELHGLQHKYDIPVLTITSKEQSVGRWARPGSNIRKRARQTRREAGRDARIIAKFRRDNIG